MIQQLINQGAITGVAILLFYFIQRYFDRKDKAVQARFEVFYNRKVDAIYSFLSAYTPLELFFVHLPYWDVAEKKMKGSEIDAQEIPLRNTLLSEYNKLRLFLNTSEMKDFDDIINNVFNARKAVSKLLFTYADGKIVDLTNEYIITIENIHNQNKDSLQSIGLKFQDGVSSNY